MTSLRACWRREAILADFIGEGHFERHLRRMRAVYGERLEALTRAAERWCGGALVMRPVRAGLHATADLLGVSDERVFREAATRRVEVMPLSAYYCGTCPRENGLILGFGACSPEANERAMQRLAQAIDVSRRATG